MATPTSPERVTLVVAMLSGRPGLLDKAEAELVGLYGPVDLRSPTVDFNFTGYYQPEMGPNLKRKFLSFANRIDPGELAAMKLKTNEIEEQIAREDASMPRPVNLERGYVCGSKLVLASAKDHAHRIYLCRGIYAEVTLMFRKGRFVPLETTYPDYRSPSYIEFFTRVRQRHLSSR